MVNLKVELGGKTYPLYIGIDILTKFAEIYQLYGYKPRAVLITNLSPEENNYFDIVVEIFNKQNVKIIPICLTAQQAADGLTTVQQVALQLVKHQFQPDETIISLGGSQVGNICAFIAQMIYGGVPYFQIPTTLTAQVVQSVEPMCHLNAGSTINLFSINSERNLVWSDVALLKSLPEKNFISGLGYIVQYACLINNGFFEFLENNLKEIFKLNLEVMEETVFRGCQCKINLSRQYSTEQKIQKRQGFGEFIASVLIESTQNKVKFGEALLFGMLIEGLIAFRCGIFDGPLFERFYQLLKQIPLYHFINQIDKNQVIACLTNIISRHDLFSISLPQEFGKFTSYTEYKLSDFTSALELVLTN